MNYKKTRIEAVVVTVVLLGAMFLAPASSFMTSSEKNLISEQNAIIDSYSSSTEEESQSYILDRYYDVDPDPAPISRDGSNDDGGYKVDARNELNRAAALFPGEIIDDTPGRGRTGKLSSTDDQDWYFFTVCDGQEIVLTMTPPTGHDYDLYLWDDEEIQRDSSTNSGSTQESITFPADMTNRWYMQILYVSGTGEGQYAFTVGLNGQNDAGTAADAGDSFAAATLISEGIYNGYLDMEYG